MKPKRTNLVAGRLSPDGPKSKDSGSPGSDGSSAYGYERLGITSDAAQAGEGQPPQSLAQAILTLPIVRPNLTPSTHPTPSPTEPQIGPLEIQTDQPAPSDDQPPVVSPGQLAMDLWDRYKDKALMAGVGVVAVIILATVLGTWGSATRSPVAPQRAVGAEEPNQRLIDGTKPVEARKAEEQPAKDITKPQTKAKVWEALSPIDETEPPEPAPSPNQGKEIIPAAPPPKPPGPAKTTDSAKKYRSCPPGFVLAGVVKTADGLRANINGAFVPAGGIVNGAKVVEVKEYSVEMELDGEYFLLGIGGLAHTPPPSSAADNETSADEEHEPAEPDQAATKDANAKTPTQTDKKSTSQTPSSKR
jgi:hypothetical protein